MLSMGIDQSYTNTGVIILNEQKELILAQLISSDVTVDFFERAWIISQKLNEIISIYNPSKITMEGLAFGGVGNATRQLSGLQYTIILGIRKVALKQCILVPPTTLKKFATDKGNSKKEILYDNLPENIKINFKNLGFKKSKGLYDVTDAYWLASYSLST